MKTQDTLYLLSLSLIFVLSGCVVRSYPLERDRVDQNLSGNRGYLQGEAPYQEVSTERKTTRTTRVVEIELHPPIKFEGAKRVTETDTVQEEGDKTLWGNRGYVTESAKPEIVDPTSSLGISAPDMEKYIVKKGETLQKISMKFYGTTKKWNKIFEANKDKLKAPNKIYPGQVIDIPVEEMKEPAQNLK